jgi:two-component system invasion response regulator UvrY
MTTEENKLPIRVFLADDHRLLVDGFRHTLKDYGIDVVEVAYETAGLIDRYLEVKPDVLVIDVRFDNKNGSETGLDVCEQLLKRYPSAKIIVFSQFDDQYIVDKSYKIGVLAFVRKDESTEVLYNAIRTVAAGREFFSPEVAQLLAWSSVKNQNPNNLLDEKELRVFTLTADGLSLTDTAKEMDLSTKTISALLKNIKAKLGLDNPAHFTKLAIRYGITTVDLRMKN